MKTTRHLIFAALALSSAPIIPMEVQRVPALPADVIRHHIIPAVAETNTVRVIETIHSINATSRFFHDAIQSEAVMLELVNRLPFRANASIISLYIRFSRRHLLTTNPNCKLRDLRLHSLEKGKELCQAIKTNNLKLVEEFLKNKYVDLYSGALENAAENNNWHAIRMLLNAGVHPDRCLQQRPLQIAYDGNDLEAVTDLLAAGANPYIDLEPVSYLVSSDAHPDNAPVDYSKIIALPILLDSRIRPLIVDAQAKRKQRLLELQGKAGKIT